jgi:lipoprotein-anchoring transpeptidase ErfK/SrfK
MIVRGVVCAAFAAALGSVVTPTAALMPPVAAGVTVGGVRVGGLTSAAAQARVDAAVKRPLRLVGAGRVFTVSPQRLGARPQLRRAIGQALRAQPYRSVELGVLVDQRKLDALVETLAKRVRRPAVDAEIVGLDARGRPKIAPETPGLALRKGAALRLIAHGLATRHKRPLTLPTRLVKAERTRAAFGSVIVINRGTNTLRLFSGRRLVRTFAVATGQAQYPTPSGIFSIVRKEENPWWYPPPSPWAAGLTPVPPGPGNPLGTRWMGLSAAGVGIHGTPSDASIGYSASHGCIRMHIPEATWLFERVELGTPVVIV